MQLVALLLSAAIIVPGCKSGPGKDEVVPLPALGQDQRVPRGVYAVVRRADVPLDEPTDRVWAIINEEVVPPLTHGAWRGNGLRVGILRRDQLDAFALAMPTPVAYGESFISQSAHPIPILETAQLRSDLRLQIDLTQPPRPRAVETIAGGKSSRLRLLARIETDKQGQHTLVLTPQHYVPSPLTLIPRDPLEKELDGRVYSELSIGLKLGTDQVAVVDLYWPWPAAQIESDKPATPDETGARQAQPSPARSTAKPALAPADPGDPAAPPRHLASSDQLDIMPPDMSSSDAADDSADKPAPPPLPSTFGSTLFTSTRIRQPVRTVLLISIPSPEPQQINP